MEHKARHSDDKSVEDYKVYYTTSYETDIDKIEIDSKANKITFHQGDQSYVGYYGPSGHEILTYESSKKRRPLPLHRH